MRRGGGLVRGAHGPRAAPPAGGPRRTCAGKRNWGGFGSCSARLPGEQRGSVSPLDHLLAAPLPARRCGPTLENLETKSARASLATREKVPARTAATAKKGGDPSCGLSVSLLRPRGAVREARRPRLPVAPPRRAVEPGPARRAAAPGHGAALPRRREEGAIIQGGEEGRGEQGPGTKRARRPKAELRARVGRKVLETFATRAGLPETGDLVVVNESMAALQARGSRRARSRLEAVEITFEKRFFGGSDRHQLMRQLKDTIVYQGEQVLECATCSKLLRGTFQPNSPEQRMLDDHAEVNERGEDRGTK